MADKKISQLTGATTPLAGSEVLPIVQGGSTVKVTTDDLTVKNVRSNITNGILQVAGPAAAATRVMTVPDANFTAARTDAAQTFTGDQTFGTVFGTTFDTNVVTAGVTLAGTILAADGTDADIDISITPKGTGEVNLTKVDIDGGAIDGTAIGVNSASSGAFTTLTTVNDFRVGNTSPNAPRSFKEFTAVSKANVAPSGTAVIDIVAVQAAGTNFSTGVAEVVIIIGYSGNSANLQSHYKYDYLTVTNGTAGGSATIVEMYDGSAGSYSTATGDFVVSRPSGRTIRITYTCNNGSGDNDIIAFVRGYSLASVSIT